MDTANAFELKAITRTFKIGRHHIPVLKGIDLTIKSGEWTSLVGASGSGKSTLLHLLGALDSPTSGTVTCQGKNYSTTSKRKQAAIRRDVIGMVFQRYHLLPELTALENTCLPALNWGWNRKKYQSKAKELLEIFGLSERFKHRPQEMSGGEQQRVALARALINDPDIILADEPTGNLDPESSEAIMAILQQMKEQKKTIVMVTHDHSLTKQTDRTLRITDGLLEPENS